MTAVATLVVMTVMTNRQLVGAIVRDEVERRRMTQTEAADAMRMSRATLNAVYRGVETVAPLTFRKIEGVLDFPRHLLTLIINGDRDRIASLDMDPDLKRHVLDGLTHPDGSDDRQRRQTRRA